MSVIQRHYNLFQVLAFNSVPRKNWRWSIKFRWIYLIVFVWLHQGIVHKNWEHIFKD